MAKKRVMICLICIVFLVSIAGCRDRRMEEMTRLAIYADDLLLESRGRENRSMRTVNSQRLFYDRWLELPSFTDAYTDLVLVHTEEEAQHFESDILVAWPGSATRSVINGINLIIFELEIDLEEFGLSFPIMPSDAVDHWEAVDALIEGPLNGLVPRHTGFGTQHRANILARSRRETSFGYGLMFNTQPRNWTLPRTDEIAQQFWEIVIENDMDPEEALDNLETAAGPSESFFAVIELMSEQGLSSEETLAKYLQNSG